MALQPHAVGLQSQKQQQQQQRQQQQPRPPTARLPTPCLSRSGPVPPAALHLLASELQEENGTLAHPDSEPRYVATPPLPPPITQQQPAKPAMPQYAAPGSAGAAGVQAGPHTPSAQPVRLVAAGWMHS